MGQGEGSRRGSEGLLGYLVDPAHHGRGYATEIVGAALDLAFGDLGLHRVTAGCFADNVASWRVMEGWACDASSTASGLVARGAGLARRLTYAVLADERG